MSVWSLWRIVDTSFLTWFTTTIWQISVQPKKINFDILSSYFSLLWMRWKMGNEEKIQSHKWNGISGECNWHVSIFLASSTPHETPLLNWIFNSVGHDFLGRAELSKVKDWCVFHDQVTLVWHSMPPAKWWMQFVSYFMVAYQQTTKWSFKTIINVLIMTFSDWPPVKFWRCVGLEIN